MHGGYSEFCFWVALVRIVLLTSVSDRDDVDDDERLVAARPKPSGPASPIDTPGAAGNSTAAEE